MRGCIFLKFEFKYEKGSADRFAVFMCIVLLAPIIFVVCLPVEYQKNLMPLFFIFVIIWIIVYSIKSNRFGGYVLYKENSIAVCRGHKKRLIPIEDIESVSCLPEVTSTNHTVRHMLVFTVILETGKKLEFYAKLDIDKDMPVQQPEEFKEYIAEQPMMKLYEYINKCLGVK